MEATSDTTLVERLARGDVGALATLYDRHGRTAYGLALRILRDAHLAEDAVQDAFISLWRGAASFDPGRASASAWIHVLVHRRAVDLVRRQERRRAREPVVQPAFGPETLDTVVALAEGARVRAALASLPSRQRHVLELAYYDGLTQSEIAARLGVPLGTVKSRTAAALGRLAWLLVDAERPGPRAELSPAG